MTDVQTAKRAKNHIYGMTFMVAYILARRVAIAGNRTHSFAESKLGSGSNLERLDGSGRDQTLLGPPRRRIVKFALLLCHFPSTHDNIPFPSLQIFITWRATNPTGSKSSSSHRCEILKLTLSSRHPNRLSMLPLLKLLPHLGTTMTNTHTAIA